VSEVEGNRLLRIVRRSSRSVVTWRRAQIVLLSVQGLDATGIAEGKATPRPGDPAVVFSLDEYGPLNVQPRPGRQCAPVVRRNQQGSTDAPRRRRQRATYTRTQGDRRLFGALDMNRDRLYGHGKTTKNRTKFLEFCRYLRSLYPPEVRIAIVMHNYSPHLSTKKT